MADQQVPNHCAKPLGVGRDAIGRDHGDDDTSVRHLLRVPAVPAKYVVKVSAKGWRAEEKEAQITGYDRVDLTFNLVAESKK